MLRIDDIPQQVADDIHAFGVMGTRKRIDTPPILCYTKTNNTKGGGLGINIYIFFSYYLAVFVGKAGRGGC